MHLSGTPRGCYQRICMYEIQMNIVYCMYALISMCELVNVKQEFELNIYVSILLLVCYIHTYTHLLFH